MKGKGGARAHRRSLHPAPDVTGGSELFLVERRLPLISRHGLELLEAALSLATERFRSRGHEIAYLGSAFIPGRGSLLSLFSAGSRDAVKAVNEAAVAPFDSIEPAIPIDDSRDGTSV